MTVWFRSPRRTGRAMVVAVSTKDPGCCESVRQMVRAEPLRPKRLLCQESDPPQWQGGKRGQAVIINIG